MLPGSVDPKTRNVPLRLENDYVVHFEGQDRDGSVLVRIARSTTSPPLRFAGARDLHEYVASLPGHQRRVAIEEVAQWVDLRLAELVPV